LFRTRDETHERVRRGRSAGKRESQSLYAEFKGRGGGEEKKVSEFTAGTSRIEEETSKNAAHSCAQTLLLHLDFEVRYCRQKKGKDDYSAPKGKRRKRGHIF